MAPTQHIFKRVFFRLLEQADSRMARLSLYLFSFFESIIIPIPTDPLLAGCVLARKDKWLEIALFTAASSVIGGAVGWYLGAYLTSFCVRHASISATPDCQRGKIFCRIRCI